MFVVGVPAWGERCVNLFVHDVLSSHAAALEGFDADVRYICHTDQPHMVANAVNAKTGRDVEVLPLIGGKSGHAQLSACNADVLRRADDGDIVVLTNADMLLSSNAFTAMRGHAERGKKCVVMCGPRTLPRDRIPVGMDSRQMLKWAMDNQHPITTETFYGEGRSALPSVVFFRNGGSIAIRCFHMHPMMVVKSGTLAFDSTTDWDLAGNFTRDEIHVVTSPDDMATAEISPPDKSHGTLKEKFTASDVWNWARGRTIDLHWWQFSHRIILTGEDAVFRDEELCDELGVLRSQPLVPKIRGEIISHKRLQGC